MLILSIDCAGHGCGVCLWQDGKVLADAVETMERGQDQRLMPMILATLQRAGKTFEQLDRVAVTRGPGSFTGLRIGLAAARGIGLAANKPVIGIDRFAVYREQFQGKSQLVVINSRRSELYCKFYPVSGEDSEATMMTAEEITMFLKNHSDATLAGDAEIVGIKSKMESEHVTAAALAAKADEKNPDYLPRPLYIRAPDVTMPKGQSGLRRLTLNDAPALAELHAASFVHGKWSVGQMNGSLALETTRGWGLFQNGKVIGFVLCQVMEGQSEILTLCVAPENRRQGVAAELIAIATDAAKNNNSDLHLDVAADNDAAIELYKKLGFEQNGRRANYYQTGNGKNDALLFTFRSA